MIDPQELQLKLQKVLEGTDVATGVEILTFLTAVGVQMLPVSLEEKLQVIDDLHERMTQFIESNDSTGQTLN